MSTLSNMTSGSSTGGAGIHANPHRTFLQTITPRRLKELFLWTEYLFYNSAHVYAALRKFGEYPITEVTYSTTNKSLRKKHKHLLENVIRVRELLIMTTLDKYVYGNAFMSMYQPFIRYLKCDRCSTLTNIQHIEYTFNLSKLTFKYKCGNCDANVIVGEENIQDRKVMLAKQVNFIRWDPKMMDIDYNPMTGTSIYYYKIPPDVVQRVQQGHKALIDTLPLGFIKAIKENKKFKFAKDAIFHIKTAGPAGVNPQWGLPPLISAIQLFHFTAVLRKSNEAIALDHLVPWRILSPAQQSQQADPVTTISLQNWTTRMDWHLKQYRQDPLHIMYAPIPVNVSQIGGQGKMLLTLGEVQEAEKNIVAALGVPMEFLYGGLTRSGMEITLRLIENQLETHINDIKDLLQWVDDGCSKFLGWERIGVDMKPFRMVDDVLQKQTLMQMWMQGQQSGAPVISDQTIAELNQVDLNKEESRIKQETLDRVRQQQEIQLEINKIQNNMATQIMVDAQQASGGSGYNPLQVISEADAIVGRLTQLDEGTKKSELHTLQMEDYVLYAVVVQRLEHFNSSQQRQTAASPA